MKLEAVIARRLKEARETAGLSQQALGVAAGIEEETAKVRIHQYEQGKHAPPFPMMERLAKVLGKPVAWFVCASDEQELLTRLSSLPDDERKKIIKSIEELLNSQGT